MLIKFPEQWSAENPLHHGCLISSVRYLWTLPDSLIPGTSIYCLCKKSCSSSGGWSIISKRFGRDREYYNRKNITINV